LTESIIQTDWHFALWGVLAGLVAFAFWAETTKPGRNISGIVLAMVLAIVLSNTGIIPKSAPDYDLILTYLVPVAISLLLFKANLRQLFAETRGMLLAFLLGTLGTVIGTVAGFLLLPLGEQAPELAAIFSATYIGGSMNLVAVANAVHIDGDLLSASVAADSVIGVSYLALLALMPAIGFIRRQFSSPIIDEAEQLMDTPVIHHSEAGSLNLLHLSLSLCISLVICAVSYALAFVLGMESYSILFITVITAAIANLLPKQMAKLEGDFQLGVLLMYFFFAVIGASTDIGRMIESAMVIVLFAAIIVTSHMLVILLGSRFLKLDLAEVIIASNACASGPTTAAALAAGKGWSRLISPALMVGIFGYVIANFIGVGLAGLLS